jgi:hypothetical protein
MKIVKVFYTTTSEFSTQNAANIQNVMRDLQELKPTGIFYTACLGADGKTFTHTAFFKSDEDQKVLNELPTFKRFQVELKASMPEIAPKQELLTLVGASHDLF